MAQTRKGSNEPHPREPPNYVKGGSTNPVDGGRRSLIVSSINQTGEFFERKNNPSFSFPIQPASSCLTC